MKKILILFCLFLATLSLKAQEIYFLNSSYAEALQIAKEQNKPLFIDFYAVWCGPCQMMNQNVFTNQKVADYFNQKLIALKVNCEDTRHKEVVKKYNVKAYPTLVFISPQEEIMVRYEGGLSPEMFLKQAQIALGDIPGFEQLYSSYKNNPEKRDIIQALLLSAPDYVSTLTGNNQERWNLRVERIYKDYRERYSLDQLMNRTDFTILMTYHTESSPKDDLLNYLVENRVDVINKVGQELAYKYIFMLNTSIIEQLAYAGDKDYDKYMLRIKNELKDVYAYFMDFQDIEVYDGMKYLYDGIYYLFSQKNTKEYVRLMNEYFSKVSGKTLGAEYVGAVQSLYEATKGKLNETTTLQCIEWIKQALNTRLDPSMHMESLIMLGDCYKWIKDKNNAKKAYDDAYVISLQFNNPGLSRMVKSLVVELNE